MIKMILNEECDLAEGIYMEVIAGTPIEELESSILEELRNTQDPNMKTIYPIEIKLPCGCYKSISKLKKKSSKCPHGNYFVKCIVRRKRK